MVERDDKRGLSTIVATLIIILLVLVATGILWVVVRNVVQGGSEEISLGKITLNLEISQVKKIDENTLNVTVKRNSGRGEFVGIIFLIEDENNAETFRVNVSLDELERRTFTLNLLNINTDNIKKIKIAPIFKLGSGKEEVGVVKDEYVIGSSGESPDIGASCNLDSDCEDFYSLNFCFNGNVYRNFTNLSCITGECAVISISQELVQNCDLNEECAEGICVLVSSIPTCDDGIQNGDEEGIDCGGSCPACLTYLRTFYVSSSTGSDANTGLSESQAWKNHPWMSTWTGSVVLAPGDTVYMKRGDAWIHSTAGHFMTVGQSGTAGKYIITTAYGTGAQPHIYHSHSSTSEYSVIYADAKSYLVFDNIHIEHSSSSYGIGHGIDLVGTTNPCHDIIITNCEINNIPHHAIRALTNSYNIIIGDINAKTIATTSSYSNHIHHFGYAGIGLMGSNPANGISNNSVYYNYVHDATRDVMGNNEYGVYFSVSSDSYSYPKYAYARYNNIQNILTWEGLDIHGGSYIYFQDNYIKNFGFVGIHAGMGPRLTPIMNNIYIERNIIEQPTSGWVPGRESTFIIHWNTVDPSVSKDIYIRDNTLYYTSRPSSGKFNAIRINGANGITISGNKIYNGATSSGSAAISLDSTLPYGDKNVNIKDNIITNWGPAIELYGEAITGSLNVTNNTVIKPTNNACLKISSADISSTGRLLINNNLFIQDTYSHVFYSPYGIMSGGSVIADNNNFGRASPGSLYYWYWGGTMSGSFYSDYNKYFNSTGGYFYYNSAARDWNYWTNTLKLDINGQII